MANSLFIVSLFCFSLINEFFNGNVNCQLGIGLGSMDILPSLAGVYDLRHFGPNASIDQNSITVSGFSSGAFMSMQFHIAHSSIIKGAGIFAGGPYGQNYGYPLPVTEGIGGGFNWLVFTLYPYRKNVTELVEQAKGFEAGNGLIDPLSNINGSNVYVFQGVLDPLVQFPEGVRSKEMYDLLGADTKLVLFPNATHTVPTDNFGGLCEVLDVANDAVNNCLYEGVFDMFDKLYDNFVRPSSSSAPQLSGSRFYVFDQAPFIPPEYNSTRAYMARNGYIYIPAGCRNSTAVTCRLHISLHGCFQTNYDDIELLPNLFALKTGYTQVADANNIVIAFPQASPHYASLDNNNLLGCWDFFGGTTHDFPFKSAPHIKTIYNIMANLAGL